MDAALMKPGEVMKRLGISRWKLREMVATGALDRVRFPDRRGRPRGYSWFRTEDVMKIDVVVNARTVRTGGNNDQ